MYVLSGKGSVAGMNLAKYIVERCQQKGILWDDDLPEYTLDFLSQLPSVSKSIRENTTTALLTEINKKLNSIDYEFYMLLCFTAHKLIPDIHTNIQCINLLDLANNKLNTTEGNIAFLGTLESFPNINDRLITLDNHIDLLGDLITSVKRGYANLGESYSGHPKKLLARILKQFQDKNAEFFFLACTDLHECKKYLIELGVDPNKIIDIIEIAGDEIIAKKGKVYETQFLDEVSDAKTYFRYKYLTESDSPKQDTKTECLYSLLDNLPRINSKKIDILDIGGSSTGHSLALAKKYLPCPVNITLQDISKISLEKAKSMYEGYDDTINTCFIHGDITDFDAQSHFDIVLCLGVLIYISSDHKFKESIKKIAGFLKPGGILITRDGVSDISSKQYMNFGGVIRNDKDYCQTFEGSGFHIYAENSFIIEKPIYRVIRTIVWKKM